MVVNKLAKDADTVGQLKTLWQYVSPNTKKVFLLILLVMISSALMELVSLGSIVPFLGILTNPSELQYYFGLHYLYNLSERDDHNNIVLYAAVIFIVLSLVSAALRLINLWLNTHFSARIGSELSLRCYKVILSQPYQQFINQRSSSIISILLKSIDRTTTSMLALLNIVSSFLVSSFIIVGLLLYNYSVTVSIIFSVLISYLLSWRYVRSRLVKNSSLVEELAIVQLKIIQESFGGIRDIILANTFGIYFKKFELSDVESRKVLAENLFLSAFPRYTVETLAFISLIAIGTHFSIHDGDGARTVIPLLGIFALGSQKILPSFQQIYTGWSIISGYYSSIQSVIDIITLPVLSTEYHGCGKKLDFDRLELIDVSFGFTNDKYILNGVDLRIDKGDKVGVIGPTGCGKSTLIDVILALLKPQYGRVCVNGFNLYESNEPSLNDYRSIVAHVPQDIFLFDDTIAANIAINMIDNIDIEKVIVAAKRAQIHDLIISLPNGYNTVIGERGIFLSGGQKQRIGIARALYQNCSFIVLDEATSALDTATESAIIETLSGLDASVTTIMIAHRLTTLKYCNKIIYYDQTTGRFLQVKSLSDITN